MPQQDNGCDWNSNKKYVLKAIEAIDKDIDRLQKKYDALLIGAATLALGTIVAALIKWGLGNGTGP